MAVRRYPGMHSLHRRLLRMPKCCLCHVLASPACYALKCILVLSQRVYVGQEPIQLQASRCSQFHHQVISVEFLLLAFLDLASVSSHDRQFSEPQRCHIHPTELRCAQGHDGTPWGDNIAWHR